MDSIEILFGVDDEDQLNEAARIVSAEGRLHFGNDGSLEVNEYSDYEKSYINMFGYVSYRVPVKKYFDDIEKAKADMYSTDAGDERYMRDFVSEVEENLSFVPKLKKCI